MLSGGLAASAVTLTLSVSGLLAQEELPLQVGITGSTPSHHTKNPSYILGSAEVQQLILEIAAEPRRHAYIKEAIADRPFTVEDMVTAGLLREEDGRYWIDFNLLRVEDQRAILEVSERLGRDLAEAFLARRDVFEDLAATHGQPHLDDAYLFYIVLGCFSLDWDGLDLTRERGYRAGAQRTIEGQSFTPWAKERGVAVSLEGLYWGSHNQTTSDFTFTSFGDHHSLPRFGLPDMLWSTRSAFSRYADIPNAQRAAARMVAVYRKDALEDVARVMLALRTHDLAAGTLASETGIEEEKVGRILDLLDVAEYVERRGDTYSGRALVLTSDDAEMVRGMLAEGRRIMAAWHEANYDALKDRLSDLTPTRNGVPFERVYTEIWHFIFGIANRTLVERGFFADPYAEGNRHQGFLPAVWANGIDELP